MIYRLRHRTTYSYEVPVTYARCILRLIPLSSPTQTLLEHAVSVTPRPSQRTERAGPYGERILMVVIEKPHKALVIEGRSRVDVHPRPLPEPSASPPWEQVRTLSYQTAGFGPDDPSGFLYPTARTPLVPAITDYARSSFPPGRPIAEAAAELMTRIRREFTYDPKATEVSTPAIEAFKVRRGVCQDFAHIMISGLRGRPGGGMVRR